MHAHAHTHTLAETPRPTPTPTLAHTDSKTLHATHTLHTLRTHAQTHSVMPPKHTQVSTHAHTLSHHNGLTVYSSAFEQCSTIQHINFRFVDDWN